MTDCAYEHDFERKTFRGSIADAPQGASSLVYLQRALGMLDGGQWPDAIRQRSMLLLRFGENRPDLAAILEHAQDNRADPLEWGLWTDSPFSTRYISKGWIEARDRVLKVTGRKDLAGLRAWCTPWWRSQRKLRKVLLQAMAAANGYQ